jgi:hypothetical protein
LAGLTFAGVNPNTPIAAVKSDMQSLFLIENIWCTFLTVPFIIILRDRPSRPPSEKAMEIETQPSFADNIGKIFKETNFIMLVVMYSLM